MSEEADIRPDITPAININFVILVMTLLIASHGAKLLPFTMPDGQTTEYVSMTETTILKINKDNSYNLQDAANLDKAGLLGELSNLGAGTIVRIDIEGGSKYSALIEAIDCIESLPQVEVAFGQMTGEIETGSSEKPATPAE